LPVYFEKLKQIAYERRPEILRELKEIKKLEQVVREYKSEYFPKIDVEIDFNWFDDNFGLSQKESIFLITLSYDIFDGLGRYHRVAAKKQALWLIIKGLMS
jgi:outer membrane protein TolC